MPCQGKNWLQLQSKVCSYTHIPLSHYSLASGLICTPGVSGKYIRIYWYAKSRGVFCLSLPGFFQLFTHQWQVKGSTIIAVRERRLCCMYYRQLYTAVGVSYNRCKKRVFTLGNIFPRRCNGVRTSWKRRGLIPQKKIGQISAF